MNRIKLISAGSILALVFLAGCSSSGGLGDIFGGGNTNTATNEIRGTVDTVDVSSRSLVLTNVNTGSMLSGGGNTVRIYYDDRTPVDYQGRTYYPENLERGDQISARVTQSGNQWHADSMTVLYNANASGSTGSSTNPSTTSSYVRGTVRYVDPTRRTIEIDRSSSGTMVLDYDTRTTVTFNGQSYRPEDLERGDEVELHVQNLGNNRMMVDQVSVVRSVSGSTSSSGTSNLSTVRGTVRYIDTSRRTIELESTRWLNFSSGGTGTTGRVIVQYDTNTRVDYQGTSYPVTNLENGDVVEIQVQNPNSSMPFANRIILVQDVNRR